MELMQPPSYRFLSDLRLRGSHSSCSETWEEIKEVQRRSGGGNRDNPRRDELARDFSRKQCLVKAVGESRTIFPLSWAIRVPGNQKPPEVINSKK
jgi:hypothetical protein